MTRSQLAERLEALKPALQRSEAAMRRAHSGEDPPDRTAVMVILDTADPDAVEHFKSLVRGGPHVSGVISQSFHDILGCPVIYFP